MADTQIPITGIGQMADGTPMTLSGTVTVRFSASPQPAPGPVINVPAGADLQAAINNAPSGAVLSLAAGATYTGPIMLPAKAGGGVTLQSAGSGQWSVASGQRVTAAFAPQMPKILSPGSGSPAVLTAPGAFGYQLIGLEIAPVGPQALVFDLIQLGDGSQNQTQLSQAPHDLTLDRCYIHGYPGAYLKRGVALNSGKTGITGCLITDCHAVGQDSQAICGWNGPGPYLIENNSLQAAGNNLLFGGTDPFIPGLTPADITLRRNTITKDPSWRNGPYNVKNLIELKNAQRVRIEGNEMAYNWLSAQTGFAILVTVNGYVATTKITDVVITNNRISHVAAAFVVGPNTAAGGAVLPPPERVTITNNLLIDVNSGNWGGNGHFLQIGAVNGLTVEHNTSINDGTFMTLSGAPSTGVVIRNNLAGHGTYGVAGDGTQLGSASLARYAPGAVFLSNVLVGPPASNPPFSSLYDPATKTALPPDWGFSIGFVDAQGDYHLAPNSPYHAAGSDGKDIGCDIDGLLAALGG